MKKYNTIIVMQVRGHHIATELKTYDTFQEAYEIVVLKFNDFARTHGVRKDKSSVEIELNSISMKNKEASFRGEIIETEVDETPKL